MARRFVAFLNTGTDPGGEFAGWTQKEQEIRVVSRGASELSLPIPENPGCFVPPGPELYGGWMLYPGMPMATSAPVERQVRRLQCHLGALRYPAGPEQDPYLPADPPRFGSRLEVAVGAFQEDIRRGQAVRVLDREATLGRHLALETSWPAVEPDPGWPCVLGEGVRAEEVQQRSGAAELRPGCVDRETGAAITAWLQQGWRKPGPVLVGLPAGETTGTPQIWLQEEAAVALVAWRALARACGVEHGIAARRAPLDEKEPEKTGLVLDLMTHPDRVEHSAAAWPVRFEGEEDSLHQLHFRLFGHAREVDERSRIADVPGALRGELIAKVAPAPAQTAAAEAWVGERLGPIARGVDRLVEQPGLVRGSVRQWRFDRYGSSGHQDEAGRFVDLTALAACCGMAPVASWPRRAKQKVSAWVGWDEPGEARTLKGLIRILDGMGDKTFCVTRGQASTVLAAGAVDRDYLRTWNALATEHRAWVAWSERPPGVVVRLDDPEAVGWLSGMLRGPLGDKPVRVAGADRVSVGREVAELLAPGLRTLEIVPVFAFAEGEGPMLLPDDEVELPTGYPAQTLWWWRFTHHRG